MFPAFWRFSHAAFIMFVASYIIHFLYLFRVFCCNTALLCRPLPTQHTHHTDTDRHRQHITCGTCLVLILVVMASVSGQAIVVGGGLARMSAANTILENGGRVVLLGESFFCAGSSTHPKEGELCLCRAKSGKTVANARNDIDNQIAS